jgi:hypothetical protein
MPYPSVAPCRVGARPESGIEDRLAQPCRHQRCGYFESVKGEGLTGSHG